MAIQMVECNGFEAFLLARITAVKYITNGRVLI